MALRIDRAMALGVPAETAKALAGDLNTAFTATGSAQTDAATANAAVIVITGGAADTGVILPSSQPGDEFEVHNGTASDKKVYPPSGGAINSGSANAAETLATTTSAKFKAISNLNFIAILGA